MTSRTRLHSVAPALDALIQAAPVERRMAAAWRAARWAVERSGLRDRLVDAALAGAKGHDLSELVHALDLEYFEQQASMPDAAQAPAVGAIFSKARAASAVNFATHGDPVEAVYEAGHATGDWTGLRALLELEL